jgi:hypothetical protein
VELSGKILDTAGVVAARVVVSDASEAEGICQDASTVLLDIISRYHDVTDFTRLNIIRFPFLSFKGTIKSIFTMVSEGSIAVSVPPS